MNDMDTTDPQDVAGAEVYAVVTDQVLDEQAVREAVTAPDCGAVVVFAGIVRDHDEGRGVQALDYSAHPQAESFLARCVAEESASTGVRLAASHRVGPLQIGDAALIAAAASPHRAEAFAALAHLVDRIKAEVPIWKRQHFRDGESTWVGL
jgi:molybdopterin synthase catalytic subunit